MDWEKTKTWIVLFKGHELRIISKDDLNGGVYRVFWGEKVIFSDCPCIPLSCSQQAIEAIVQELMAFHGEPDWSKLPER